MTDESTSGPERLIEVRGVQLCSQSFGDSADPPILLVMGIGASMLWWEDEFCQRLAEAGRYVIRYDQRDTGRSVTYPIGSPAYTGDDLIDDAAGVLDAYDIQAAHVIGVSAGGALAQLIALDHPGRVRSLVLISTSPAQSIASALPSPTENFGRFVASRQIDWDDEDSVVDHLVDYASMLAGAQRPLDEAATREFVRRDVARANVFTALQNHDVLPDGSRSRQPLSAITAPTLVIHGTVDPMFAIEHGEALAREIPSGRLLALPGGGHGIQGADWDTIIRAVVEFTEDVGRAPA